MWYVLLFMISLSIKIIIFFRLGLTPGDRVSIFADVDGKCKRGLVEEYEGRTLFVGNGCAKLSRRDLFGAHATLRLKLSATSCC